MRMVLFVLFVLSSRLVAQTFSLNVLGGYGSGDFHAGDTVRVWAKEHTEQQVFSEWQSTIPIEFHNRFGWYTTFVMPAEACTVRAILRNATPLVFREVTMRIEGIQRNIWFAFPETVRGVITLHHFTNGTGNLWNSRVEYREFCHTALQRGYALVAYNANEVERGDLDNDNLKQWKALPIARSENEDHRVTKVILDSLEERGIIHSSTPRFAVGMSVGGGYTLGVSLALAFKGFVNFCSGGNSTICDSTNVAGIFSPAQFDANKDDVGANVPKAFENYSRLIQRGIPALYMLNTRHPLYPERFARVPGISIAQSRRIALELKTERCLDEQNQPIVQSDSIEKAIRFSQRFPELRSLNEDTWKEALYQYRVAFADHEFHSYNTNTILDFFERQATSVYEEKADQDIRIYPNPACSELTILGIQDNTPYTICTLAGEQCLAAATNFGAPTSVAALSSGAYILRIKNKAQLLLIYK